MKEEEEDERAVLDVLIVGRELRLLISQKTDRRVADRRATDGQEVG